MSETEHLKLAEQQIAALNAHDLDRYLQGLDESYVSESELAPGPVRRRAGARRRGDDRGGLYDKGPGAACWRSAALAVNRRLPRQGGREPAESAGLGRRHFMAR